MNQTQRKFLIDKINSKVRDQIQEIEDLRTDAPSVQSYLLKEISSGTVEMLPLKEIKDNLKSLALGDAVTKKGRNGKKSIKYEQSSLIEVNWRDEEACFKIPVTLLVKVPEDFDKRYQKWQLDDQKLLDRISEIKAQTESLVTRIQLASDKTLDGMIKEIDDMGNISLMDKTLRKLIAPESPNKKQRQLGYGK